MRYLVTGLLASVFALAALAGCARHTVMDGPGLVTVPVPTRGETVAQLDWSLRAAHLYDTDLDMTGQDDGTCNYEGDPTCAHWLVTSVDHAGELVAPTTRIGVHVVRADPPPPTGAPLPLPTADPCTAASPLLVCHLR